MVEFDKLNVICLFCFTSLARRLLATALQSSPCQILSVEILVELLLKILRFLKFVYAFCPKKCSGGRPLSDRTAGMRVCCSRRRGNTFLLRPLASLRQCAARPQEHPNSGGPRSRNDDAGTGDPAALQIVVSGYDIVEPVGAARAGDLDRLDREHLGAPYWSMRAARSIFIDLPAST